MAVDRQGILGAGSPEVQLKSGLCPFHNEKTPSFTVNDDKQFYHCFSSGEHGDVIKFLEKTENLSFIEAVERLAAEAGMDMPERDPFVATREKEAATLIDVMEMAAAFFQQKLHEGVGAEARAYLERRSIKGKTLDDFGVGYAPESRHELMGYLTSRKITVEQMAEAGLIISGPDIATPYDRFRNRVMFPIADARGRVIAFGGRALSADAKAKYLNSPDTPLFHKGRVLYNLNRARKPAYDDGTVIAVEGYMDVIGLAQGGIYNAVAPLGTALTEDQIGLLWRMAPEPILCFDGDRAGIRAAFRAIDRIKPLLRPGHSFRFALLPSGSDPDDLVRDKGADAFRTVVSDAKSYAEMAFSYLLLDERLEGPDDRGRVEVKLDQWVSEIPNEILQRHYRKTLRDWLWNHFAEVFGWKKFNKASGYTPRRLTSVTARGIDRDLLMSRTETELLACLFCSPELVNVYFDPLHCIDFLDRQNLNILQELFSFCSEGERIERSEVLQAMRGRGLDDHVRMITTSMPYRRAIGMNSSEDLEVMFLASLKMFVARGQYAEINRDALALSDDEIAIKEFYDRVTWLSRELRAGPIAGDDSEFFKIAEEYRARRALAEKAEIKRTAAG